MYCTRCGSELREKDRFCSQCGVSVASPHEPLYGDAYPSAPPRQLARLAYAKKIAGVCAGFARYFDCDVTLMRVIFLLLAFGTGIGFIGYIVAWIVMPVEHTPPSTAVARVAPGGVSVRS